MGTVICKTGRSRDVRFEGTISGNFAIPVYWGLDDGPPGQGAVGEVLVFQLGVFSLSLYPYVVGYIPEVQGTIYPGTVVGTLPVRGTVYYTFGVAMRAEVGAASSTAVHITDSMVPVPMGSLYQWAYTYTGTIDVTLPTEETVTYITSGPEGVSIFPTVGGVWKPDFPVEAHIKYQDRIVPGGTVSATIRVGTAAASASGTVVPTVPYYLHYVTVQGWYSVWNTTGGASAEVRCLGELLSAPWNGEETYGTVGRIRYGAEPWHMEITAGPKSVVGTVAASLSLPIRYVCPLAVYAGTALYPQALCVVWKPYPGTAMSVDFTGETVLSGTQVRYNCSGGWNYGTLQRLARNDFGPVVAYLDASSLSSAGEAASEWRLLWHGRGYEAVSVQHQATVPIGGAIIVPGTVDLGSVVGMHYRWMRLEVDTGGAPITCIIGNKVFEGHYDGSAVWFDLCGPDNCTVDVDYFDTRWPYDTLAAAVDTVHSLGVMWGVQEARTLVFGGSAAGTVGPGGLTLCRRYGGTVWFMPKRCDDDVWPLERGGQPVYVRRFVDGDVDGRRAFEYADGHYNIFTSRYRQRSIQDVLDSEGSVPTTGLTLAPRCPTEDGTPCACDYMLEVTDYQTTQRPATWLQGGGLVWVGGAEHPSGSAGWLIGTVALGDASLWAYPLADSFEITPQWGDGLFLYEGAYGTAHTAGTCPVGKLIRSCAFGITYDYDMDATKDVLVEVHRTSDAAFAGSDRSDVQGQYQTGLPFACGRLEHDIHASGTARLTMYSANRQRVCFAVPTTTNWLSLDCNAIGLHARAYEDGGKIVIGVSHGVRPPTFVDLKTDLDGEHPRVRWDNRLAHMPLIVAFERDGTCYTTRTSDCGRTFDLAITLGRGKYPVALVTPDGRYFHYWWQSGSIKVVISDYKGSVLHGPVTAIASADEDVFDVDQTVIHRNTWLAVIQYRSGGNIVTATSEDGVHFT